MPNTLQKAVCLAAFAVWTIPGAEIAVRSGGGTADLGHGVRAILWREPADISSRNLLYGSGGRAHQPAGAFTFVEEDRQGSNPKFDVRDENGVKWKVKLGPEASPEVVATRLVWAVGYYANEDYFLPELHVENMPHLKRGQKF